MGESFIIALIVSGEPGLPMGQARPGDHRAIAVGNPDAALLRKESAVNRVNLAPRDRWALIDNHDQWQAASLLPKPIPGQVLVDSQDGWFCSDPHHVVRLNAIRNQHPERIIEDITFGDAYWLDRSTGKNKDFILNDTSLSLTPVPEQGVCLAISAAALGFFSVVRRRRELGVV